ncbi:MAG: pilus assembly protein [Actinomycetaceae bacterium]|nr:pilus assembly protein [Actinomycetaceae bacterium]MDY5273164.1 TadE family protein [Arcanobacterium sp.]
MNVDREINTLGNAADLDGAASDTRLHMSQCQKRRVTAESGMVSVEWALTIPLFIVVVLVCAGALAYASSVAITTDAAREAARAYSVGKGETEAKNVALAVAGRNASVTIREEGEYVRVSVRRPPVDSLAFLGFTVQSQHVALIEPRSTP